VPIILLFLIRMKKVQAVTLLVSTLLALQGCGSPGPSPEQQARDADQQREAERQQAEFRKSLPPVSNPGQGW
jgi:predicted small lipoprotein YifL